jgi:hypothetical protein
MSMSFLSRRFAAAIALAAIAIGVSFVNLSAPKASGAGEVQKVDGSQYRLPPEDAALLTDLRFEAAPVAEAIAVADAISSAQSHYMFDMLHPSAVRSYLETATELNAGGGAAALKKTPVWIIKLSGLDVPAGVPLGGDPSAAPAMTVLYVVVDAITGEFQYGEWH